LTVKLPEQFKSSGKRSKIPCGFACANDEILLFSALAGKNTSLCRRVVGRNVIIDYVFVVILEHGKNV
jgi:hypothetical protein